MIFQQDSFAHPLSPQDWKRAAALLAAGRPVYVGQTFLAVDLELGVRRALEWVRKAEEAQWHPAEGFGPF